MPASATTTCSTMHKRLRKIPIKTLPRTFQDAIVVTRKLEIKYLWIDSLCIIQDSSIDWQKESSLMGKVYSHAFCTLAASASLDCHGGLFPDKSKLAILCPKSPTLADTKSVVLKPYQETWNSLFHKSVLNERGWCLQERELSPRILYFTDHTTLFECREAQAGLRSIHGLQCSTPDFRGIESKASKPAPPDIRRCLDISHDDGLQQEQYDRVKHNRYTDWLQMIEGFSIRKLTVRTDKFPAVSGLAVEYAYLLDDTYVAGIWLGDLLRGLCWRSHPAARVSSYVSSLLT